MHASLALLPLELNGVPRKNKGVECADNYDGRKIVIRNFNPILTPTIEILHFYPLSSFVTEKFFGIHNDTRAFTGNFAVLFVTSFLDIFCLKILIYSRSIPDVINNSLD